MIFLEYKKRIYIPVWDDNILVSFSNNIQEAYKKEFSINHKENIKHLPPKAYEAVVIPCEYMEGQKECCVVFFNLKTVSQGTISHECFHIVNYILKARGLTLSDDSEETYCYLLGFLVDHVNAAYRKAILKKNKK